MDTVIADKMYYVEGLLKLLSYDLHISLSSDPSPQKVIKIKSAIKSLNFLKLNFTKP